MIAPLSVNFQLQINLVTYLLLVMVLTNNSILYIVTRPQSILQMRSLPYLHHHGQHLDLDLRLEGFPPLLPMPRYKVMLGDHLVKICPTVKGSPPVNLQ